MRALGRAWSAVRGRVPYLNGLHVSWLHAKVALAVWAVLLLIFTPDSVQTALGDVMVWVVAFMSVSGAAIASMGLVLAARDRYSGATPGRVMQALTIELVGLTWMLLGGLVAYMATQFTLELQDGLHQRIALTALAYSHSAFLLARIAMVTHHRRKERAKMQAGGGR